MPVGGYKVRAPGSLKEAEALLVYICGGAEAASRIVDSRVGRSQMQRYTDDSEANATFHMPIDIVRKLEQVCGNPVVTKYLAMEVGGLFLPVPRGDATGTYLEHLGKIGEDTGEFFRQTTGALSDGIMEPREAGEIKGRVIHLATCLGALLVRLNHVIDTHTSEAISVDR